MEEKETYKGRIEKIIKKFDSLKPFKSPEDIPVIPVLEKNLYDKHIVKNLIRCGAIPKNKLKKDTEYIGQCRLSHLGIWNGETFDIKRKIIREGESDTYQLPHFETWTDFDIFVPLCENI